jgi:tetratricopeptide (TPR) repeat protein
MNASILEFQQEVRGLIDQKRFDAAIEPCKRLIAADLGRNDSWYALAYCYAQLGQNELARAAAERALQLGHANAEAILNSLAQAAAAQEQAAASAAPSGTDLGSSHAAGAAVVPTHSRALLFWILGGVAAVILAGVGATALFLTSAHRLLPQWMSRNVKPVALSAPVEAGPLTQDRAGRSVSILQPHQRRLPTTNAFAQEITLAAQRGDVEAVRELLDRGADPDARYPYNFSDPVLYVAAQQGSAEIVRMLLDHGAYPDNTGGDYQTALHRACYYGNTEAAAVLLDDGADIEARTNEGITPLYLTCEKGRIETAKLLLDRGASVDCANGVGWTPLFEAAQWGQAGLVQLFLEHSADPNRAGPDVSGHGIFYNQPSPTPMQAARNPTFHNPEVLRLMIQYGGKE